MSARGKLAAPLLMSERDWQALVVDAARLYRWTSFHVLHARGMEPGWPDLVLLRDAEAIFVELKTESGKVSAAQGRTLDLLESAGLEVHVWRPSHVDQVLARLARKPAVL